MVAGWTLVSRCPLSAIFILMDSSKKLISSSEIPGEQPGQILLKRFSQNGHL